MLASQNGERDQHGGRPGAAPQLAKRGIREAFDGTPDKPDSARIRRDDSPTSPSRGGFSPWETSDVNDNRRCALLLSLHTARE